MSTQTPNSKESAGTTPETVDDLPRDALQIGVDTQGLVVYYSRIHTSIYVAGDNEIVYTRSDIEPGESLIRFVDHVSRTRGWKSTNLYSSFPEAFAAQLEDSQ